MTAAPTSEGSGQPWGQARWWLGAGVAWGTAVATTAAVVVIPPWVGLALWAVAAGLSTYGLRLLIRSRAVVFAASAIPLVVTYVLWHATSPHADVAIVTPRPLGVDRDARVVNLDVPFVNNGGSAARGYVIGDRKYSVRLDGARSYPNVEQSLRERMATEQLERTYYDFPINRQLVTTLPSETLSPAELTEFVSGDGLVFFWVYIRYRDWWPVWRETSECLAVSIDGHALNCSVGTNYQDRPRLFMP